MGRIGRQRRQSESDEIERQGRTGHPVNARYCGVTNIRPCDKRPRGGYERHKEVVMREIRGVAMREGQGDGHERDKDIRFVWMSCKRNNKDVMRETGGGEEMGREKGMYKQKLHFLYEYRIHVPFLGYKAQENDSKIRSRGPGPKPNFANSARSSALMASPVGLRVGPPTPVVLTVMLLRAGEELLIATMWEAGKRGVRKRGIRWGGRGKREE